MSILYDQDDDIDNVRWTHADIAQRESDRIELGQQTAQSWFLQSIGEEDLGSKEGIW